jgi:hypothetical protein
LEERSTDAIQKRLIASADAMLVLQTEFGQVALPQRSLTLLS